MTSELHQLFHGTSRNDDGSKTAWSGAELFAMQARCTHPRLPEHGAIAATAVQGVESRECPDCLKRFVRTLAPDERRTLVANTTGDANYAVGYRPPAPRPHGHRQYWHRRSRRPAIRVVLDVR